MGASDRDTPPVSKVMRQSPAVPRTDMNELISNFEPPKNNIIWQTQRAPARCEHQREVIAYEEGGSLERCIKCGSLEAE